MSTPPDPADLPGTRPGHDLKIASRVPAIQMTPKRCKSDLNSTSDSKNLTDGDIDHHESVLHIAPRLQSDPALSLQPALPDKMTLQQSPADLRVF